MVQSAISPQGQYTQKGLKMDKNTDYLPKNSKRPHSLTEEKKETQKKVNHYYSNAIDQILSNRQRSNGI